MVLAPRTRRLLILALAIGVPVELLGSSLLKYVPRIGLPREPDPWLRFGGDLTALLHAPWLILSNFLCVKFCPPPNVLSAVTIAGGYLDSVGLTLGLVALFRAWRNLLTKP